MATEELEKQQAELKALEIELAALLDKRRSGGKETLQSREKADPENLRTLSATLKHSSWEAKPRFRRTQSSRRGHSFTQGQLRPRLTPYSKLSVPNVLVIAEKLSPETAGGPESKRKAVAAAIDLLQAQLSGPQRAYQAYLQALKEWEAGKAKIIGAEDALGSIKSLQKQLSDLDGLPVHLKSLRKQRNRKLLEIFREKQKLRIYYETYYGAVQSFLKQHSLAASEQFQLTFNVSMAESGFSEAFLGRLNRRKVGPFMGDEEGAAEMKRLLDSANFDSALGILRFTNGLCKKMAERLMERRFCSKTSCGREWPFRNFTILFTPWDSYRQSTISNGRGRVWSNFPLENVEIFYSSSTCWLTKTTFRSLLTNPRRIWTTRRVFKTLVSLH